MMSPKALVASGCVRGLLAAFVAVIVVPPGSTFVVPWANAQTTAAVDPSSRIHPDQLDSLVAPIALYPDPLLAQTLAASTYPLELLQLQQWLARNPGLKDKALLAAVERQPWDPSIKAMAALPDVVKWLAEDIQWTTDLGNAFLAQEADVMSAVQRMRAKAQANGNLQSTPQQTVETEVVENRQVIVIEQADPQVLYVPSYNPTAVWGASYYPYPPIYYPPAGYYAGRALAFGAGVAMGSFWGGGWGWNAGWGHNDININRNNTFNRNANISGVRSASGTWQHNAAHRGGAPYRDRATANRYGGTTRGDSLANRQSGARQQIQRQGGSVRSGVGTAGAGSRAATGGIGQRTDTAGVGSRAGSSGFSGADRVGSRDVSRGSGGNRSAFSGGSDRFNGSSARASSNRGSSSMRSSRSSHGGGSRSFSGGSRSRGGGFGGGGGGRSRGGGRR
jgi:Protein of unknown function (DUF3300)